MSATNALLRHYPSRQCGPQTSLCMLSSCAMSGAGEMRDSKQINYETQWTKDMGKMWECRSEYG